MYLRPENHFVLQVEIEVDINNDIKKQSPGNLVRGQIWIEFFFFAYHHKHEINNIPSYVQFLLGKMVAFLT